MNRHLGHYAVIFNNKKCGENVINDKREFNDRKKFQGQERNFSMTTNLEVLLNGSLARHGNTFNAGYGF